MVLFFIYLFALGYFGWLHLYWWQSLRSNIKKGINKSQEISWLAGKSKFDFSKQNSFFCSSDENERNFTMSNWIYSILFLINTNNDNLKRRKGKQFQLCFVIFLWGIIRMTSHCSVWFYAEMRKYVIFEFDFAWVPQRIYNYLIPHCKEERPKFNNKNIRLKKNIFLPFSVARIQNLNRVSWKTADLYDVYAFLQSSKHHGIALKISFRFHDWNPCRIWF